MDAAEALVQASAGLQRTRQLAAFHSGEAAAAVEAMSPAGRGARPCRPQSMRVKPACMACCAEGVRCTMFCTALCWLHADSCRAHCPPPYRCSHGACGRAPARAAGAHAAGAQPQEVTAVCGPVAGCAAPASTAPQCRCAAPALQCVRDPGGRAHLRRSSTCWPGLIWPGWGACFGTLSCALVLLSLAKYCVNACAILPLTCPTISSSCAGAGAALPAHQFCSAARPVNASFRPPERMPH